MQPRYSDGTKVKIKTRDTTGQIVYRELERYENMSGVVINSKVVIGYPFGPVTILQHPYVDLATKLYMYTVKLEEGVTPYDLSEYCLEQI